MTRPVSGVGERAERRVKGLNLCRRLFAVAALISALVTPVRVSADCVAPRFPLYEPPRGQPCLPYTVCEELYCSCMGLEFDGTSCAAQPREVSRCDETAGCVGRYVNCVNNQSVTGRCGRLLELYVELLTIAAGTLYNTSGAYSACQYTMCQRFNDTFGPDACEVTAERDRAGCTPTAEYDGQIVLSAASWRTVLSRFGALGEVKSALQTDLRRFLSITQATLLSVSVDSDGRLVAAFTVPGASEANSLITDARAAAKPGRGWILRTVAAYQQFGGSSLEASSIQVLCFGAGCWPSSGGSTSPSPSGVSAGSPAPNGLVSTDAPAGFQTARPRTTWGNTVAVSSRALARDSCSCLYLLLLAVCCAVLL